MTQEDAFKVFINNNKEKYPDLVSNVEISSFTAPTYLLQGKLIVNAKTNATKYNGSVEIIITKLEVLTERDKILQYIKEAQFTKANDNWRHGWENYQLYLENYIEHYSLVLTQEQLADHSILKNILIKEFFADVEADLKRWDLPKDFIKNFVINSFWFYNFTNTKIPFYANVFTRITSLNNTKPITLNSIESHSVSYVIS